jgi:adenylate cyclase
MNPGMNHFEIERKFLVTSNAWQPLAIQHTAMRQGYLNNETGCSVRVRTAGEQAWLNIKGVTIGARRLEFEYPIPLVDAQRMMADLTCKPLIEKTRYFIEMGRHTWEVDVFEGDNAGLIVAEIELEDPDESFEKPDWVGEEVTHDPRYYNTCLSSHPYKDWNEEAITP